MEANKGVIPLCRTMTGRDDFQQKHNEQQPWGCENVLMCLSVIS